MVIGETLRLNTGSRHPAARLLGRKAPVDSLSVHIVELNVVCFA